MTRTCKRVHGICKSCLKADRYIFTRISIDGRKARTILEDLCDWDVVVNDELSVLGAIDMHAKCQLSFWDSLILEAAHRSGVTTKPKFVLLKAGKGILELGVRSGCPLTNVARMR